MAENTFNNNVDSLFKGMENFITTKTVVGEPIKVSNDTVILPLVDVSFGVGAGAVSKEKAGNSGGGMGGKMSPSAVLVIKNGVPQLVNIKEQGGLTKVLDMVPGLVDKFTNKNDDEDTQDIDSEEQEINVDN
jgi:uncharacterized spore protein YtfJ